MKCYLWVRGPTIGLANSCTKALEANIMPTATVSSTRSLCRCWRICSSRSVAFSASTPQIHNKSTTPHPSPPSTPTWTVERHALARALLCEGSLKILKDIVWGKGLLGVSRELGMYPYREKPHFEDLKNRRNGPYYFYQCSNPKWPPKSWMDPQSRKMADKICIFDLSEN